MWLSRFKRIAVLGALFLLVGIIADQSICFSCPTEIPDDAGFTSLDEAESCVLCLSRLIGGLDRDPPDLQTTWERIPRPESPVERLLADPVDHPPRH